MRCLAIVIAIALCAAQATRALFGVAAPWGAPLGVLVAGGALIAIAVVLRDARSPARRRRGALPSDPGIPREPLGAPYRGPR